LASRAGVGARRTAAEPDSNAAAVAAGAQRRTQRRQRRRAASRDHGDEYLDMNIDVIPDWQSDTTTASARGVGALGFAGTESESDAPTAGLVTMPVTDLGDGARMPLLPTTWGSGRDG
jgi:PPE-repeat protein